MMHNMTHKFSPILIALTTIFALSSCLGDNEDETTYYTDTAISAFTLGTLNVTVHTTASDGVTDSTYTATYDGSAYKFNIDQLTQTIYNLDSLPIETDVAHVLATITTVNSGTAILNLKNQEGKDSLAYYSSEDSIDFTNPVRIRVYNMYASAYREYTVTLNVHKERGNDFSWKSYRTSALGSLGNRKMVALGDGMYVISPDGMMKQNGESWETLTTNITPDADIYNNVAVKDGYIYVINNGEVLRSSDGQTWNSITTAPSTVKRLIGATDKYLYALGDGTFMRSADNGATWEEDKTEDGYADCLPTSDVNFVTRKSAANGDVTIITVIGNRSGKTVVWGKTEEANNDVEEWIYYNEDSYNTKTLPYLENLHAVRYGDNILATGGDFSKFYTSPDDGLTWDASSTYDLPETFGLAATPFTMAVDSKNNLYISKNGSANVYKARLAKLGWKEEDRVFTRATK